MKNRLSLATVCFGWLFMLAIAFFFYPKWQQTGNESTIGYDVAGYYGYLPALCIYNDLGYLGYQDSVFSAYGLGNSYPNYTAPNGRQVMKYPLGAAVMYLPWFAAAHWYALAKGQPADGYSRPYQAALSWGCLIYTLIGLIFARKVLLTRFSDKTTSLTLLLLIFGSNYLNYAAIDNAMTHSLLFTLFSMLIWLTIAFYKQPKTIPAIAIGALTGLAIITRPSEIVICLIPILWGVADYRGAIARLHFFRRHILKIISAVIAALAIVSLQLIYWKFAAGHFIEYTYTDQGFDFLRPHLYEVLFTFRKGWWVYTPVMLLIIPGFIFLRKKYREIFPACFLFFLFTLWIVASWEIWWYGGSLGQRALVQSYAILLFPLAAFAEAALQAKAYLKIILTAFILFCVGYNMMLTWQAHAATGIFEAENMNRPYFWKTFFRTRVSKQDKLLLDRVDIHKRPVANSENIRHLEFEDTSTAVVADPLHPGNHVRLINKEFPFYSFNIARRETGDRGWLHISAMCYIDQKEWDIWKADQIAVWFLDGTTRVKSNFIRIQRILDAGYWSEVYFDAAVPKSHFDSIEIAFIHLGSRYTLLLDNIRVSAFD